MKKIKTKKDSSPVCIGIVMDGNRRWAKEHKLPIAIGHSTGYEKLKEFVLWANEVEVRNIIAYAFSTENWNRNKKEIEALMVLFGSVLKNTDFFEKQEIRVKFIGERKRFSESIIESIEKMENITKKYNRITLLVAVSYGGRVEIVSAVNNLLKSKVKNISEKGFSKNLWTANIPDPDIIIRTGGEKRLSNFLPWQSIYSELFFIDTYWPAFTKKEFNSILVEYGKREKRKGK